MRSLSLGVDLGGTNARAAVVDRDSGELVAAHKVPLSDRAPEAVAKTIRHACSAVLSEVGAKLDGLSAVGVGAAGQCLGSTGVILNAPNLGWRDVPFGDILGRELGVKAHVVNDLSAAAWGERCFGAARGIDDAALVFVGSGVGSGLILGGRLHNGAGGVAGEFGHTKVRDPRSAATRQCGCGERGCLEAYAGGVNLARRVREELQGGAQTLVRELAQDDPARVTASVVDRAAAQGDAYAVKLWEEVGSLLGLSAANLVTLLNPARLILGGGVLLGCGHLVKVMRQTFDASCSRSALRGLTVEPAHLGDDAGVIGAALL